MRLTVTGASDMLVDAIEHADGLENSLAENLQEIEKIKEQLRKTGVKVEERREGEEREPAVTQTTQAVLEGEAERGGKEGWEEGCLVP